MTLTAIEKNAVDATKALLDFSKVTVSKFGIREALWQHPDFPSLNALSDVLTEFEVPNIATRLTPDQLNTIPVPALVHLEVEGGIFAPVRKVGDKVEWFHTQRGWQQEIFNEFIQKWSGITLLLEPNIRSGERNYTINRRRELLSSFRTLFISGVVILTLINLLRSITYRFPFADYLFYFLGLIKLAGIVVSSLLLWSSLEPQNRFLQKICRFNNGNSCQNILNTSAAWLTDWLSWAEVGFFYFIGGFLAWTFGGVFLDNKVLVSSILYFLTLIALPYTVWSVYYQWIVAKEWCVMCLLVQALLWGEFFVGFIKYSSFIPFKAWLVSTNVWEIVLTSFLIAPVIWVFIKPHLQKSMRYESLFRTFQKLKFDPNYLSGILSKHSILPPIFNGMKVITLGSLKAENILTVIMNPSCIACRHSYKELINMLQLHSDIHVQIILAASPNEEDIAGKVTRRILNLPTNKMAEALSRWFELGEAQHIQWVEETAIDNENFNTEQLALHLRWLELAGVRQLPTTFLNNAELPTFYDMHELPKLCAFLSTQELANSDKSIF